MFAFSKIDADLLCNVWALKSKIEYKNCIIWVSNYQYAKSFLINNFGADCIVSEFPFIRAIGLCLTTKQLLKLSQYNWLEYISTVLTASIQMNKAKKTVCVQQLHDEGINGEGVTVAIIDTGCAPHLDLVYGKNRIIKWLDLVNNKTQPYDDNGHGTFVAGVLSGNGLASGGEYSGIAPMSNLVVIKAMDQEGQTQSFKVLDAMQWVFYNKEKFNIKVMCMSFGSTPLSKNDPLVIGANRLWDNGIVVVCAGGNDGPQPNTIRSPGASPKVVTVGSIDSEKPEFPVAEFSSRGPIFEVVKPDVVAPGVNIKSLSHQKELYTIMSGTSVSTPFVAGLSALLLQKEPNLTPNQIKRILLYSSLHLPYGINNCGMGLIQGCDAFDF